MSSCSIASVFIFHSVQQTTNVDFLQCGAPNVTEIYNRRHPRVMNGSTTTPGAHPWTASIRSKQANSTSHKCGATIISEYYVVTAGHCLENVQKNMLRVRVGDWDMEVQHLFYQYVN